MTKKKIAIIGTQGLPNRYGGFETLVDYLTKYLSSDFDILVFCSSKIYKNKLDSYNGAKLKYLPFYANGLQSLIYDSLSLLLSLSCDKILILGASGALVMPFCGKRKDKFYLNLGGLDWKRIKWNYFQQKFIKFLERCAVKNCKVIVADNQGIEEYLKITYNLSSQLIEYGGDQVFKIDFDEQDKLQFPFLKDKYALSLARIQPDNNIELIIKAFINIKNNIHLVFIGNWDNSEYGLSIKKKYSRYDNLHLLDAVYDQNLLNKFRSNCYFYIHGHSAGGTNPALVEAMNLGLPVFAYSNGFNEFTTEQKAIYFKNVTELIERIFTLNDNILDKVGKNMLEISKSRYQWKIITAKYAKLFRE